jgi:GIY-YIG catalytic domain
MPEYSMVWTAEIELKKRKHLFGATDEMLEDIPEGATGVYIFCRRHGSYYSPQYVGSSKRLRKRLEEHLNSVDLMEAIAEGGTGTRVILIALVKPHRGQSAHGVAVLIENHLIKKFHAEGYELVNERGTKRPTKSIQWRGTNEYLDLIPRYMLI